MASSQPAQQRDTAAASQQLHKKQQQQQQREGIPQPATRNPQHDASQITHRKSFILLIFTWHDEHDDDPNMDRLMQSPNPKSG